MFGFRRQMITIYRKRIWISILILAAVILACTACGQKATTMQLVKAEGEVGVLNDRGKSMDQSGQHQTYENGRREPGGSEGG